MPHAAQKPLYMSLVRHAWPSFFTWTFRLAPYALPLSLALGYEKMFRSLGMLCPTLVWLKVHLLTVRDLEGWAIEIPAVYEF